MTSCFVYLFSYKFRWNGIKEIQQNTNSTTKIISIESTKKPLNRIAKQTSSVFLGRREQHVRLVKKTFVEYFNWKRSKNFVNSTRRNHRFVQNLRFPFILHLSSSFFRFSTTFTVRWNRIQFGQYLTFLYRFRAYRSLQNRNFKENLIAFSSVS